MRCTKLKCKSNALDKFRNILVCFESRPMSNQKWSKEFPVCKILYEHTEIFLFNSLKCKPQCFVYSFVV